MILLSLLRSKHCDGGLLRSVSIYFRSIKTNGYSMLHLHCLIRFKGVLHLPTLYTKIQGIKEFYMRLLAFLEYIIKCSIKYNALSDTLHHTCSDTRKANTIKNFMA